MSTAAGGSGDGVRRTRRRRRRRCGGGGAVMPILGESFCRASEERHLTVQKTSLFSPGDGFAVYEHHHRRCPPADQGEGGEEEQETTGELVFRVDSYGPDPHLHAMGKRAARRDELTLMDPDGHCILTVRRKWPSLHQRWEGFLGERTEGQKPLFSVRRDSIIPRSAGIGVEVYRDQLVHLQYRVEGSFPQRCCAVYEITSDGGGGGIDEEEEEEEEEEVDGSDVGGGGGLPLDAVAEIRRKVVMPSASPPSDGVVLGRDVFCLLVAPGFDAAFAMGLVLVLDRMTADDGGDGTSARVHHHAQQQQLLLLPPASLHPPAAAGEVD